MGYRVTVLPGKQNTEAAAGENLLAALRRAVPPRGADHHLHRLYFMG